MSTFSKLLLFCIAMLPSYILAQVSAITSGDEFYELLGLQKIVEAIYEPMLSDQPTTVSLDELKAAFKSEFVIALNSRFSLADLRRGADHMQTHNELPDDISSWVSVEAIAVFTRAANQLLNPHSIDPTAPNTIEIRTINSDEPE